MNDTLGEPAAGRIVPEAAEAMRAAIEDVGGREVFFAGALTPEGLVERVRVCARGHEGAVPAIREGLRKGEVVMHNHPSGTVAPSDADLQLASLFSFQGHGVYIVDNTVERVYVVVEPFLEKDRAKLDPDELAGYLDPGGKLAGALPQFEVRPQQSAMMAAVAQAFNDEGIAVVEAPTGVGKTLAYLLPAVLWAVRNGERVVVSTKTINLQEQVIQKDLPLLARALGLTFSAVLVKGRNNYLCQRKLNRALSEASLFDEGGQQAELKQIAAWAEKTEDGSLSDLPFVPRRELWSQICSESDTCRISNCPNPNRCFIGKARREIAKADILVVNHHMLFSDLAVKRETGDFTGQGVLPAYRRLVFDEAHSIEDSATEYFGMEATRLGGLALIGRFLRLDRGQERGLLPYLKVKLMKENLDVTRGEIDATLALIDNELIPRLAQAREALNITFDALRSLTADRCAQIGRDVKWRLTPAALADAELRELHQVHVLPTCEDLAQCAQWTNRLLEKLRPMKPPPGGDAESPLTTEVYQLEAWQARLQRLAANLAEGTSDRLHENTVRWIEIDAKNNAIVRVVRCPLEVAGDLAEWVYRNLKTVVMTSATLTVRKRFDYLFGRIGLNRVVDRPVQPVALPTPFDFQKQALLLIPTDIAQPNERDYRDDAVDYIEEALRITRGRAFVLFTSYSALNYTFQQLEPRLRAVGITPLKQGAAARTHLLERFRGDVGSVLFGTDSFWEGVDVAGEALQCVILPKLPFRVPTEPILEARAEAIEEAGGNPFMELTVPQAVIKFRQGFGRLIRRTTDRGTVLILDRRVIGKYYGRIFLESLPGMRVVRGPRDEVMEALEAFHGGPVT